MAEVTRMKTELCITVDTEFDIAGTFVDPARFAPIADSNVWCREGDTSHGLGFLLSTFAEHRIAATFFVEALNSIYFGDQPMKDIAQQIVRAGHDVQLHLHPVWTYFSDPEWRNRLSQTAPNDSFVGREQDEVERLIEQGRRIFSRWGIGPPLALRTGGLHVDLNVYRAMQAQGMMLASNVGVGIYEPQVESLQLYGGRHRLNGVVEVPVLTYQRRGLPDRYREKALTVTGSSWREMRELLMAAQRDDVGPVVLLTHPHEFAKPASRGSWRVNQVNQLRLRRLCEFLAQRRDAFDVVTFAQRADEWRYTEVAPVGRLSVSAFDGLRGLMENAYNDWVLALGICVVGHVGALANRIATDGFFGT